MIQIHDFFRKMLGSTASLRSHRFMLGLILGTGCLIFTDTAFGAQGDAGHPQLHLPSSLQIFTFFFLMLGPIKLIGPFAKITHGADAALTRRIAFRATFYAAVALLLAGFLGESLLTKYGIPLPVLVLAAGLILFLVALQGILQQFTTPARSGEGATVPGMNLAMSPIAFPTIVTPYGTAALIIFVALSMTINDKLIIGFLLLGIMVLNMIAMLAARYILRVLGVALQLLGAVLGIIQVALGLQLVLGSLKMIWA